MFTEIEGRADINEEKSVAPLLTPEELDRRLNPDLPFAPALKLGELADRILNGFDLVDEQKQKSDKLPGGPEQKPGDVREDKEKQALAQPQKPVEKPAAAPEYGYTEELVLIQAQKQVVKPGTAKGNESNEKPGSGKGSDNPADAGSGKSAETTEKTNSGEAKGDGRAESKRVEETPEERCKKLADKVGEAVKSGELKDVSSAVVDLFNNFAGREDLAEKVEAALKASLGEGYEISAYPGGRGPASIGIKPADRSKPGFGIELNSRGITPAEPGVEFTLRNATKFDLSGRRMRASEVIAPKSR